MDDAFADFVHFSRAARGASTLVFVDEATTDACVYGRVPESKCRGWDGAPKAINRASRTGLVKFANCSRNPRPLRGRWNDYGGVTDNVCVGEYVAPGG